MACLFRTPIGCAALALSGAILWGFAWMLVPAAPASAAIIHANPALGTPDPTQPPPPNEDPGWDQVGSYGVGAAVYLGKNADDESWILTAAHLGAPGVANFDGVDYPTDGFVAFKNPDDSDADLRAWKLVGHPPLTGIADIATILPTPGQAFTLIARGFREGPFTCWNSNWTIVACGGESYSGYRYASPGVKHWATNLVSPLTPSVQAVLTSLGYSDPVIVSAFDEEGTVLESQASNGDSGGPLFVMEGGTFKLAGITIINLQTPTTGDRPNFNAVFGSDYSVFSDLSYFRGQVIEATGVPLPEASGGLCVGTALLWGLVRRRKARVAATERGATLPG